MAGRGWKAQKARPSLRREIAASYQAMYEEWQDGEYTLHDLAYEEDEGGYDLRPDLEPEEDPIWDFLGDDLDRLADDGLYEHWDQLAMERRFPDDPLADMPY